MTGTSLLRGLTHAFPARNHRGPYAWLPALVVALALAAVVAAAAVFHYAEARLVESTGESLALTASVIADKLDQILVERYGDVQIIARARVFQQRDAAGMTQYLKTFRAMYGNYYYWMAATDAQGRIVAATDPISVGWDRSEAEWFRSVRYGQAVHVEDAHFSDDASNNWAVAFTAAVRDPQGRFLGAVTTRVGLSALEDAFARTIGTLQSLYGKGARVEWQVLKRDGDVVADSLLREEGKLNLKLIGLPSALFTATAQPGYVEEMHLRRNVPVISGYAQTEQEGNFVGLHWGILVRMDRDDIVAPIRLFTWKLTAIGAGVFVPVMWCLIWATGRLRNEWVTAQTERARAQAAEADLRPALVAAEAATKVKSEFLATMSHEIRTPMNGVIGMTGLLLDTDLTAEQRECAEVVRQSGEILLQLINDILDFSKFEAGKLDLDAIPFDPRMLIEDVAVLMAERAHAKGLELACLIHTQVPVALQGDPGRLRQVLINLVGNAVKFTERGEVLISATVDEETDHDAVIRLAVTDTGIGLTPEQRARLFQPFTQSDGSTTRKYGGTGLGLAICKQIAERMDGRTGVVSEPGRGSTFWFTARMDKAPVSSSAFHVSRSNPKPETLSAKRILVVDDNATSRTMLQYQTTVWEMRCASAEDAPSALEMLRAAALRGEPYDLAILDLMMPGMDGLQLARAIKADLSIAATRLVLLTSFGQRGHAAEAQQVGIAAYLTKPVRDSLLHNCLAAVLSSEFQVSSSEFQRETRNAKPETRDAKLNPLVTRHTLAEGQHRSRVLVVEDNVTNQVVAVRMLEKLGYRADVAADGKEAVVAVARLPYDLVLMDCQMPEMNGFEATKLIRERESVSSCEFQVSGSESQHETLNMKPETLPVKPETLNAKRHAPSRRVPIIAMTADAMQGDRERCMLAGMDDYLSKPVKLDQLAQALERRLSQRQQDQELDGISSRLPEVSEKPALESGAFYELRETLGADRAAVKVLIQYFLQSVPPQLAGLRSALAREDAAGVEHIAHSLKSTCLYLGAQNIASLLRCLEDAAREGQLHNGEHLIEQAETEFQRARDVLVAAVAAFAAGMPLGQQQT